MYSKRLDALARAAIVEAFWLDDQEATKEKPSVKRRRMR
jgi:hypothetical protein